MSGRPHRLNDARNHRGTYDVNQGITKLDRLLIGSGGLLTGSGLIDSSLATNFGVIAPGHSAGALSLAGNLIQKDGARLVFEIGGLAATNDHDVLNVVGAVGLTGELTLSLINNFYPATNATFALLNYASASGNFSNITNGTRLNTTDNLGSFEVIITTTNVNVSNYLSPDSDGDGMTDYVEFLAGTDRNNPQSVLVVASPTTNPAGHFVLSFPYVAGKSYRILYTDDLASGVWNMIVSPSFTEPMPDFYEWFNDGTLTGGLNFTNRFYRVGLQ